MVGSWADSLDFSAQYAPPQDLPMRGILSFFCLGGKHRALKTHTIHQDRNHGVNLLRCCSRCRLKSNNFPTLPTKSSSPACCVGLSFSGRPTPIDGWLLVVTTNHPLPTLLSLRASRLAPGHHHRPPPCDHRRHFC